MLTPSTIQLCIEALEEKLEGDTFMGGPTSGEVAAIKDALADLAQHDGAKVGEWAPLADGRYDLATPEPSHLVVENHGEHGYQRTEQVFPGWDEMSTFYWPDDIRLCRLVEPAVTNVLPHAICNGCGLAIEDAPYLIKEWEPIGIREYWHSKCFVQDHSALLEQEPAAAPVPTPTPDWANAPEWANYACLWLYSSSDGPFFRWRYFECEPRWGERNYNRVSGKWGDWNHDTPDIPLSEFIDLRATLQRRQGSEGD